MNTNKKYWLRGGIIFLGIYLIAYLLAAYVDVIFILLGPVQIIVNIVRETLNYSISFISPDPYRLSFALNILSWFLTGAIFGWVYGKFKNSKLEASTQTLSYPLRTLLILSLPSLFFVVLFWWLNSGTPTFSSSETLQNHKNNMFGLGTLFVCFCLSLLISILFRNKSFKFQTIGVIILEVLSLTVTYCALALAGFN